MNNSIGICSVGVSCPGGIGWEVLKTTNGWPVDVTSGGGPGELRCEVSKIDIGQAPFNRWRMLPRLRRASALSHHLIEAVSQCLQAMPEINRSRIGVVGAFFLGALDYSVRFYKGLTDDGRRFASPLLFPETVVNSPLSHVVAELGIGGPVYSQTGDTSCWSSALRTAQAWLANDDAEHVVVVGAEEFNAHELNGFDAVRWLENEMRVAEGAGAVMLRKPASGDVATISQVFDGFCYRSRAEAAVAASALLDAAGSSPRIADTASSWIRPVVDSVHRGADPFSLSEGQRFEAFTASCAWNTIMAAQIASSEPLLVPYWGLSQQIGGAMIVQ
jgi:hypothetical protein